MEHGNAPAAGQQSADPLQDLGPLGYAARLAETIWRKHYQQEAPNWNPLPDLLGVLTQIDNMVSGLTKRPDAAACAEQGWQPIETAPKDGRTLLLGQFNSHNKWRTARGQWFSADVIAETWEDPECEEGWYETSVECEADVNCWATNPTHWMPLPPAPGASLPPPARNGEMSTQDAKDAARYRWLRDRPALSVFTGERVRFRPFDCPHEIEVGQIGAVDLDDAIDAALSASCAPKQTDKESGNGC